MPTTYAHDLFGQKVYRQLPNQVKKIIRKNGELYRIGLHGPDIFFYYFIFKNHVSSVGYRMHKEKARAFFAQGMAQVRETGDEALLAYLLGFGCHYLLDSSCHPFVNEIDSHLDHRVAMSFAVAGLLCDGPLSIKGGDCVKISYPEFYEDLYRLGE